MSFNSRASALILAIGILLGLTSLGYLLGHSALEFKRMDRTVTVKGLSEREYPADVVIWPIKFSVASNDLEALYSDIERNTEKIRAFLILHGVAADAISHSPPAITDKSAQSYGNTARPEFRYTAHQTVTVYSTDIPVVRSVMNAMSALGKEGIVFTGGDYRGQAEYLFTRLNAVKPDMIEEATHNARQVAKKFAADSDSTLGKIRKATQGQFSISSRDTNNPQIKKVRVVSTIEYYLSD